MNLPTLPNIGITEVILKAQEKLSNIISDRQAAASYCTFKLIIGEIGNAFVSLTKFDFL